MEGDAGTAGLSTQPHCSLGRQGPPLMSRGGSPPWSPSLTFHRELATFGFHHKTSCANYRNTCVQGRGGRPGVEQNAACSTVHDVHGIGPAQAPQQGVPLALPDPAGSTP